MAHLRVFSVKGGAIVLKDQTTLLRSSSSSPSFFLLFFFLFSLSLGWELCSPNPIVPTFVRSTTKVDGNEDWSNDNYWVIDHVECLRKEQRQPGVVQPPSIGCEESSARPGFAIDVFVRFLQVGY